MGLGLQLRSEMGSGMGFELGSGWVWSDGGGEVGAKCIARTGSDVGAGTKVASPTRISTHTGVSTGVSTHVEAMNGDGPRLGAEVENRTEFEVQAFEGWGAGQAGIKNQVNLGILWQSNG